MSKGVLALVAAASVGMLGVITFAAIYVVRANWAARQREAQLADARGLVAQASEAERANDYDAAFSGYSSAIDRLPGADDRTFDESELANRIARRLSEIGPQAAIQREARLRREEHERKKAEADKVEAERQAALIAIAANEVAEEYERAALMAEKARQMYPDYKRAAETLADEILRLLSALEVGITYSDYSEALQELQFAYNKFILSHSQQFGGHASFAHLKECVSSFRVAMIVWKGKIEGKSNLDARRFEESLQEEWSSAEEAYKAAMADLAVGK